MSLVRKITFKQIVKALYFIFHQRTPLDECWWWGNTQISHFHKGIFCIKNFFLPINLLHLLILRNLIFFFCCKDFSVHLFARFHFMNTNVYLAMLIFCSCRSRRYRKRATIFVPLRFTQTPQKKCKSIVLFKRVFLQYKTSEIQYCFTAPEMFE